MRRLLARATLAVGLGRVGGADCCMIIRGGAKHKTVC